MIELYGVKHDRFPFSGMIAFSQLNSYPQNSPCFHVISVCDFTRILSVRRSNF